MRCAVGYGGGGREEAREGGRELVSLCLLCALPFNLCSQQNECTHREAQHPRLQHPADESAPWEGGRAIKKKRKGASAGEEKRESRARRERVGREKER